jgi:hypothetical protein
MTTFNPKPCPCGCKKWIMSPWFNCQCSSVSTGEKDTLVRMARDANRWAKIDQIITAVERAKSSEEQSPKEHIAYLKAKRDVVAEIAKAIEEIENAPAQSN